MVKMPYTPSAALAAGFAMLIAFQVQAETPVPDKAEPQSDWKLVDISEIGREKAIIVDSNTRMDMTADPCDDGDERRMLSDQMPELILKQGAVKVCADGKRIFVPADAKVEVVERQETPTHQE